MRLKETNQTLIHVVFGLMTSLAKLTNRDFSSELGPNLSFSASIDSSQLAQIAGTAEMLDELPRLLLLLGKKVTSAYEIAYQRRYLRSCATRIVVKSQKSRKMQFPASPVARLKQDFESLLRSSLPVGSLQPVGHSGVSQVCVQEEFPPQLLPQPAKLHPSQSLDRLKAHSSSPRRSGSLTERTPPSQTQQFTRTLLCINKDLSQLSSRQQRTPKQVSSFTEMLGNLHKRQLRLAAFRPKDWMEASTLETSRGRPGLTPLSKTSSLSPFHPTYRPRIPLKLPLFP